MGRLLPLIEVSVNICAIVSDFTGNSGGFQRWRLLTKCIYLLYRQAVNVKLLQQSLAKTSQILKPKLALLLLQILPYCCSVRYLCSNRQFKQINNSLKTIVEQLNSVFYWKRQKYKGIESVAKKSIISLQKCRFKSSIIISLHTFMQLNLIGNQRQQFCLVRARKRGRRNSGYPYQ